MAGTKTASTSLKTNTTKADGNVTGKSAFRDRSEMIGIWDSGPWGQFLDGTPNKARQSRRTAGQHFVNPDSYIGPNLEPPETCFGGNIRPGLKVRGEQTCCIRYLATSSTATSVDLGIDAGSNAEIYRAQLRRAIPYVKHELLKAEKLCRNSSAVQRIKKRKQAELQADVTDFRDKLSRFEHELQFGRRNAYASQSMVPHVRCGNTSSWSVLSSLHVHSKQARIWTSFSWKPGFSLGNTGAR